jgi:hypothetical protein
MLISCLLHCKPAWSLYKNEAEFPMAIEPADNAIRTDAPIASVYSRGCRKLSRRINDQGASLRATQIGRHHAGK